MHVHVYMHVACVYVRSRASAHVDVYMRVACLYRCISVCAPTAVRTSACVMRACMCAANTCTCTCVHACGLPVRAHLYVRTCARIMRAACV